MLSVAIACILATTNPVIVEEKPAKPESLLLEEEELVVTDTELEDLTGEIVFDDADEEDPDADGSDEE